jgi:hypothetical protein
MVASCAESGGAFGRVKLLDLLQKFDRLGISLWSDLVEIGLEVLTVVQQFRSAKPLVIQNKFFERMSCKSNLLLKNFWRL